MNRHLLLLLLLLGLSTSTTLRAQTAPDPLTRQAERVVGFLRGEVPPADLFTVTFLAAVPPAQLEGVRQQLVTQHGAPRRVAGVTPESATGGTMRVEMERATLALRIQIEPQPPHRIAGLLVTGADVAGDSLAAISAAIAELPGRTSFAAVRLGDRPQTLAAHQAGAQLAIGSAFKLYILGELDRQVAAGTRRWSDTVTLNRRSLPSGVLQTWPEGAPVTLHSLAALMISQSDNTATDTLLHTLGRANVERQMAAMGHSAPERNRPFLGTMEAFALKAQGEAAFRDWAEGDAARREALLAGPIARVRPADMPRGFLGGNPVRIDTVEWFASAEDLVRAMDWLRTRGSETARAILAINPGLPELPPGIAYAGFKGGSEPGVINMTFLVRSREGGWHAVTGSWNNPAAPVDNARFAMLLIRAVPLLR